jgi:hypothetical protein
MKKWLQFIFGALLLSNCALAVEELVIHEDSKFNPSYENRFSFVTGLNPSMTKATDIINFNFAYTKKMEDYWFDATFLITNGTINKLTTNNFEATGETDTNLYGKKSTMTTFGLGVARESRYSQTLLPFDGMYEVISADLTYNLYKGDVMTKSFYGPGMIAKFSLFKKLNDYVSMGPQLLYNLAVVKRAQELNTETSSSRSLTLSYVTIGFDVSFSL